MSDNERDDAPRRATKRQRQAAEAWRQRVQQGSSRNASEGRREAVDDEPAVPPAQPERPRQRSAVSDPVPRRPQRDASPERQEEPVAEKSPAAESVSSQTLQSDINALRELERHLFAHRYAESGMGAYGLTIDPPNAAEDRAEAMATLLEEDHNLLCSARMGATLDRLNLCADRLDEVTRAQAKVVRRDRERMVNVSPADSAALSRLTNEAMEVWTRAKAGNDWESFAPYLDSIVDLMRHIAVSRDASADPYDVWLDEYEQGTDAAFYDEFFRLVKDDVVPLLMDVSTRRQPSRACIEGRFDEGRQWLLARDIAILQGVDLDSWWLTASEHPFSDAPSMHYAITAAHVYGDDITSNVFTMLHEGGHNLYEQGVDAAFNRTSLAGGTSMGMHEAQARFFENYIGRSRAFAGPLLSAMQQRFHGQLDRVTPQQFYLATNRAVPGPIRMEADELTYPLHIAVRYEIEKLLMSGQATAADVPGLWRDLYKAYLGVSVADYATGPLQDSHWASGGIGYFPTYALGSAYGAQLRSQMIADGIDWEGTLSRGDLAPIRDWLRAHVWRWGRSKEPAEIIRAACHTPFDPRHYTNYLREKFSGIYGL